MVKSTQEFCDQREKQVFVALREDLGECDPVPDMKVMLPPSASCRVSQSFRVSL